MADEAKEEAEYITRAEHEAALEALEKKIKRWIAMQDRMKRTSYESRFKK